MTAPLPIPVLARGLRYWGRGYLGMMRFDLLNLRTSLPVFLVVQVLMGAGTAILYGFYFADLPGTAATFIATGAPALAVVPVGMALVPGVVLQHKLEQTYDFVWSLPVPRMAAAMSTFTLFTLLALPGTAVALAVASWRYDIALHISWMILPALLLTSLMASSVGFGFAHAIPDPALTNLVTNLIIFAVLLFSPVAFPIGNFPDWLASVHRVLPFWHMANVIRAALTEGLVENVGRSYLVLGLWTVGSWMVTAAVIGRRR
jgi:ABC-2 type transport system permease protein